MRLRLQHHTPAAPEYAGARRLDLGTCGGAHASHGLPGTLTSAVSLGFKFAFVEVLKLKLDERKRLEAEREALIDELEASLSPELALQVETIIDRRSSFVMPGGLATLSLPKPPHVDGAEAEGRRGTVREVRRLLLRALSLRARVAVVVHDAIARTLCRGARARPRPQQRLLVLRTSRRPCRCCLAPASVPPATFGCGCVICMPRRNRLQTRTPRAT